MTKSPVGSPGQPLRVAIVGTGPSGMYAAAALLQQQGLEVQVDLFDRLPAPFGLVRYGVAPDHQKIKSVTRVFEKVAGDPRVRFLGNAELSRDLSRQELLGFYHQVVYAVGAQSDREMGIPGEELAGSWSSTEFVAWYNCHPDYADASYPLRHDQVAVVGIGNVAMDVARILAKDPEELASTDIADAAVEELRGSGIQEVWVLARRGPVQAKCSPAELKELGELSGVQVVVEPGELELDPGSQAELESDKSAQKNMEHFRAFASEPVDPGQRHIRFRFLVSPVEVLGEEGRVAGLRIERNALTPRPDGSLSARGTGEFETLPVTLVVRAIGYRSHALADLPFDPRAGVIPNREGRVLLETGEVVPREHVVGWVKRGPTGLIGSNKMDAVETVNAMLEEVPALPALAGDAADPESVVRLLAGRGVRVVTYPDWQRLDQLEVERGRPLGRPRVKMARIEEMLRHLEELEDEAGDEAAEA